MSTYPRRLTAYRLFVLAESLEPRRLLSAAPDPGITPQLVESAVSPAIFSPPGFTPAQIKKAYAFNQISFPGGVPATGAGQTIAIVDAYNDPNISLDLGIFDTQFGLPAPPQFTVVGQTGSTTALPRTDPSWAQEIAMDVEWAHAMAPGANILLVETTTENPSDLLAGVNLARAWHGVTTVSMSWGQSEMSDEVSDEGDFTPPTGHKGVIFVAAAGDQGSNNGPDWPAISPNVIGVGGTTLVVADSSGTYHSERAWSGTTSGYSVYEREPAYQLPVQTSGKRSGVDFSWNADPSHGFSVFDSIPYQRVQGWFSLAGTSAGAPQIAGLIAIANQGRTLNSEYVLASTRAANLILYSQYSSAATYSATFRDITTGFGTSRGYDLRTGLGSPIAYQFVNSLIFGAPSITTSKAIAPGITAALADPPSSLFNSGSIASAQDKIASASAKLLSDGSDFQDLLKYLLAPEPQPTA